MLCVCSVFVDIIVLQDSPLFLQSILCQISKKNSPWLAPRPPAKTRMKMLTTVTAMKALPHTQLDNQQTSFDSVRWIKQWID